MRSEPLVAIRRVLRPCGLDGQAMDNRGDVAGEVGGVGAGGEIAIGFGPLKAPANRGLAGITAGDQRLSNRIGFLSAGKGALHDEASAGVADRSDR